MTCGDTCKKVLIIDDYDDAAATLAILLTRWGYRAEVARSGEAGLAAAIATKPDAILLDLDLPGLDGYQVASRLRSRGDFDEVLIIAVTGFAMESDRRRSREAGIDHHLVKPCDVADIMKLLSDKPGARAISRG